MEYRFNGCLKGFFTLVVASIALLAAPAPARAANGDPIVLVHGFAGFGRDELLGYKYWGGFDDLEAYLNAQGRTTRTAVVGPFSSNWDRAVELYYQIKGGCVDYGAAHAAYFGHARTVPGKCFPGLHPQWDAAHPVHLVAHSQGGQTSKMLIQLLEDDGDPYEPGLFGGAKHGWVKSLTTLASPLNGTSLTEVVTGHIPFVVDLVGGIASIAGVLDANNVYDFKLEQWGLKRKAGESFCSYRDRVKSSAIWGGGVSRLDLSLWSLSPDGADEENDWVETWPNVHYFSYATRTTFKGAITGWEYPLVTTNALIVPFAYPAAWPLPPGIGNYTFSAPGHVTVDGSWWANDAVVNTRSMQGPWNASSVIVSYAGSAQKGKWNYMGLLDGFDHFDVIGWTAFWDARGFYLALADRVRAL
jgi:triacylglycerol lipase